MTVNNACLPIALGVSCLLAAAPAITAEGEVKMSPEARQTEHNDSAFKSDPFYDNRVYDYDAQLEIYGGKSKVDTPRPLVELGKRIYDKGMFPEDSYIFGELNPVSQQFTVFGDWRTAAVYSDVGDFDRGLFATKLTLELDYKLTGTERLHVGLTPLNRGVDITRYEFSGENSSDDETVDDFTADSAFFEGDLGAIISGFSGEYTTWDMPIAFGLMPLQFQNGIWVDDAFTGIAVSAISKNSKALDISNFDVTFFAGFDKVNSPLVDPTPTTSGPLDSGSNVYGIATFFDANLGYWELDYGYTEGEDDDLDDQSYHNVAVGFTRRYGGWLSNSVRVFTNFGQDRDELRASLGGATADGTLLLLENSLITRKPSTFIPYFNFFVGKDAPQALARGAAAGGVLKNVGITFESDNMTGFPALLDASGRNTFGGALGIEYLFDLSRQLVVEIAAVNERNDEKPSGLTGTLERQAALGIRYQQNLSKAWLVRFDAIYADNKDRTGADTDFSGARVELRRKF